MFRCSITFLTFLTYSTSLPADETFMSSIRLFSEQPENIFTAISSDFNCGDGDTTHIGHRYKHGFYDYIDKYFDKSCNLHPLSELWLWTLW